MKETADHMDRHTADATDKQNVAAGNQAVAPSLPLHSMYFIVPLVIVAGLAVAGAMPRIRQSTSLIKHTQMSEIQSPSVSYVIARPGPPIEEFTLPGDTEAIQVASIYARVDGYLAKRYADIGDKVHKGQVLAEIDTPELDQQVATATNAIDQARAALDNSREALSKAKSDERTAVANVAKARADVEYDTIELQRYVNLARQGAVSLEDSDTRLQSYKDAVATLDANQHAASSAAAAVRSAQAAIHVSEAALKAAITQRDQYAATRSFQTVKALFDGVVTKRNVDAGALVSQGSSTTNQVLFEIGQIDTLRIFVYVPEQFVPDVKVGHLADLEFQAYPSKKFTGTVIRLAGGLDPLSKTLQCELHVQNPDHKLLPGMYCQVGFKVQSQRGLTILPATTVQTLGGGQFVYVVGKDNRVQRRNADIRRDLGSDVEMSTAVSPGEKVILSPSDEVVAGLLVSPEPAPEQKDTVR